MTDEISLVYLSFLIAMHALQDDARLLNAGWRCACKTKARELDMLKTGRGRIISTMLGSDLVTGND